MDSIRTLLLARTHTVVLDPDRVASATTRPTRDVDVDKFEDELAQLGFVMSLDLAMTIRRLPYQTILELRSWITQTLPKTLGPHKPDVPLARRASAAGEPASPYLRRMLTWLATRPVQPCPWCGQSKLIGALDPCGHLVCRACWDGGSFAGCPICHRRVAIGEPLAQPAVREPVVTHHDGQLHLLHLGFDLVGAARARFERLVGRNAPLSRDDRAEIEVVIDAMGPKTVTWLPPRIPCRETMAIALARLWMVAADRAAMVAATRSHLASATDVLRVAAVLLGGNPWLVEPMRLASIGRGMRRAVLAALDQLPADQLVEDMWRHRGLWKRVGERLHPFEHAERLPVAALGFAAVRQTRLDRATFGPMIRDEARGVATVRIADDRARVTPWASSVEQRLRAGDARAAAERLGQQPGELLCRVDQLVRVAQARQPDALAQVIGAVEAAAARGSPARLLALASHIARRTEPWPRRVFVPNGDVLAAWGAPDRRSALRGDVIGAVVALARAELVGRAAARRTFARAVIDRGLIDLRVPTGERSAPPSKLAWPRGSEVALDTRAGALRLTIGWEDPAAVVDLHLAIAVFDAAWRHVATCDAEAPQALVQGDRVAVHSRQPASGPPFAASEHIDLDLAKLHALGGRYAVMIVASEHAVAFDRLSHCFACITAGATGRSLDPATVAPRFDLLGKAAIAVPLVIDLAAQRVRWLDVRVGGRGALRQAGGYRAALAHLGRDFADLAAASARPTLWDVAAIHAVARANIVYVRAPSGATAVYRRRDKEQALARLARLHANSDPDGSIDEIPPANAPTWFALLRADVALPAGSTGYALDARNSAQVEHLSAVDLLRDLSR